MRHPVALHLLDIGSVCPQDAAPAVLRRVQVVHAFAFCESPGLCASKNDVECSVRASLEVMDRDSRKMRDDKPFIFTNCLTGKNIEELADMIIRDALFDFKPAAQSA